MPEYQFANGDGSIVTEDYDKTIYFSAEQVLTSLKEAFGLFPYPVEISQVENLDDVFHVVYPNGDGFGEIFICGKGTTPGGRPGLKDEQRIQPKAKYLNYVYDKQAAGKKGVFLGVYSRDGQTIFCTWKVMQSNAASQETPISKQIKIHSIAKAMREGFVQHKGRGEYACAFKPEFLYFYLRNSDWLHTGAVSELAEHTEPENNGVGSNTLEELVHLNNNKLFIFGCLDWLKERDLFSSEVLNILQSKEECKSRFAHYSAHGILYKIDRTKSEKEQNNQRYDDDGNPRYYTDRYSIGSDEYFVSKEWKEQRKAFVDWISSLMKKIRFDTGYQSPYSRNRILFGAPGTGKSYTLNRELKDLLGECNETDYERVTFHPDYSYANFVGTYKPVPCFDSDGKESITYEYVPGPFMRVYVDAIKSGRTENPRPHLLIIEEINRTNVAAVFGDVFQLLDRGDDEVSEYPIQASKDIKNYLAKELGGSPEEFSKIRIPDNMFIWATMNSADQGVFPMDTAFKRRWDFTYLGINNGVEKIQKYNFKLLNGKTINWNALRTAINNRLASLKINEDKLMGPFFLSKKVLEGGCETFVKAFKNKVLMYIFEDAGKQRKSDIFRNNQRSEGDVMLYSALCDNFDKDGIEIFCDEITKAAPYIEVEESETENE